MDLASEELPFLSIPDILKKSVSIPKQSPKTFYLYPNPDFPSVVRHLSSLALRTPHRLAAPIGLDWRLLGLVEAPDFPVFLPPLLIRLLSTLDRCRGLHRCFPLHLQDRLFLLHDFAIPSVFKRLSITFLWVSLSMIVYNVIFLGFLVLPVIAVNTQNVFLFIFSTVIVFVLFLVVHVYISASWHLASVVSVLDPVYDLRL